MSTLHHAGEDVLQRLAVIFRQTCNVDPPAADSDLIESGLLDSLTLVELLFAIEQEFSTRVSLESLDIDDIRTMGGIASVVMRSLQEEVA